MDAIAKKAGHTVITPELEKMTHEVFIEITPQRWKSVIRHVKDKVEDHYWEVDGLQRIITEEFIIQLKKTQTQTQILALTQKAAAHMTNQIPTLVKSAIHEV